MKTHRAAAQGNGRIEGGELTPSMKLRRKPILEKYAAMVDGIYRNS